MMPNLWELIVNAIETILFFFFIKSFLSSNKKKWVYKCSFLSFLFVSISYLNFIGANSLITVLFALIGHIIFAILFFDNRFSEKIFYGAFFSVICILAEFIPFLVLLSFSNNDASSLLINGSLRILSTSIYLFLIILFILIFRFLFNKETYWNLKDKLLYISINLAGITISHLILLTTVQVSLYGTNALASKLTIINIAFLILFLSLDIYIYNLSVSQYNIHTLMEQKKQYELEEQQYRNLLSSNEKLRSIKHDMEIHLQTIQQLALGNNHNALIEYISEYMDTLRSAHSLITSGNTAIDCILSSKIYEASSQGIKVDYSIVIPALFKMDVIELSALLGNLWNNAIDACKNMISTNSPGSAFIRFYIKPFQDMTIIHIENCYDGIIAQSKEHYFISRKSDIEHGYGIKRITEIVTNENGLIQITTDNKIFSVHIMLPLKEEKDENNNT